MRSRKRSCASRLPSFDVCVEREALRLRYDQRDRFVGQRTEAINRLRSVWMHLEMDPLPRELSSKVQIAAMKRQLETARIESDLAAEALLDDVRTSVEDIERFTARIKAIEAILRPLVRRLAPELLALTGISTVVAAGLIGHAGSLGNCRDADAFAMRAGTAPVHCSSGKHSAVRVNYGGNRKLNRLLYIVAFVQMRIREHAGRAHYERKRMEGKSHRAALRSLKRRLSVVVYYRLKAVARRCDTFQGVVKAA